MLGPNPLGYPALFTYGMACNVTKRHGSDQIFIAPATAVRNCNSLQPQRIAGKRKMPVSFHPREKQAFVPKQVVLNGEHFTTIVHEVKYFGEQPKVETRREGPKNENARSSRTREQALYFFSNGD
jgi:hypothetical protein